MISDASNASWHPAFMPNTTTETPVPKATLESPAASPALTQDRSNEAQIEPETLPETLPLDEVPPTHSDSQAGSVNGDNSNHAELTNLRDALTTSLSSPGGVEMDENPLHTAPLDQDSETAHAPDPSRADFPAERPKHDSKHQSTTSFARTVSQEVNWGEDDEVDPEWNLHRTDTDPFKMMAQSDRTNSFPAVPTLQSWNANHLEQPLPHSQAEEIVGDVEKSATDLFSDDGNDGDGEFFAQQSFSPEDSLHSKVTETITAEDYNSIDQGQSYGGDVTGDGYEESQARFEEGLPLVQPEDSQLPIQDTASAFASTFADDGIDEDDFFANVNSPPEQEPTPRPDGITRKSTMQIIDSMDFQPQTQVQQDILEEEDEDEKMGAISSSESSLDKAIGGGLGSSKSTILSQVLSETVTSTSVPGEAEIISGTGEVPEDDLAAKWKAALEEDEFLDDNDELLDDDQDEGNPVDPAAFFGSDDEGFLEETDDLDTSNNFFSQNGSPLPAPVTDSNGKIMGFDNLTGSAHQNRTSSGSRYMPADINTASTERPRNPYAPVAPLLTDLSRPALSPAVSSPYMSPSIGFPGQQQQQHQQPSRPEMPKAQSFADKAKGGYASPYDLPMEVVKPRQRTNMQSAARSVSAAPTMAPPPRSSSRPGQKPPTGPPTTLSPPTSSHGPPSNVPPLRSASLQSKGGFFEDLPMVSRPKPSPKHSLGPASPSVNGPHFTGHPPQSPYLPAQQPPIQQQGQNGLPPQSPYLPSQPPPNQQHDTQNSLPQPTLHQGLVAPERVSPYANLPSSTIAPPAISSRYSPAPPQSSTQSAPPPVSQSRYSPAPPSQRSHVPAYTAPVNAQPTTPILAHQPRTSSPLAHFERSSQDHRSYSSGETSLYDRRSSSSGYEPNHRAHPLSPTHEVDENQASRNNARNHSVPSNPYAPSAQGQPQLQRQSTQTPPPLSMPPKSMISPSKRVMSNYVPQPANNAMQQRDFVPAPPKRSQTQSPGTAFAGPRLEMSTSEPYARPASVQAPSSPHLPTSPYAPMNPIINARPRGFSQGLNYVAPTDGRENDPLQRWRGSPVFAWGVGGTFITSFPKDVPRYGMNQSMPMIVRSPGEVKTRNIKDVSLLEERLTSFPGPLKGKSKKKDLLAWLTLAISNLEQTDDQFSPLRSPSHESKRKEERVLLWKTLRVFIEHDGILEGNPVVEKAVRAILSPGLDDESFAAPVYSTGADLSSISASTTINPRADPVDPAAVDQLRKHLLRGEREKAVWEAVDKRLWAHAMLISNTVSKDLYKQVAQEFVQKEVKIIGDNTESLAALYEIFAGNFEESIDELVPPSARAGFQMVSTSNASGPSKDALAGLDRWRETLGLVLSNRSTDDSQALNALGKLLSGYGRAEAAHICFLFARTHSVFGGVDDPLSSIVLVGSDHQQQPYGFDKELEPILLSEVYEYGLSLSNTSVSSLSIPHLAVYKLQHAAILAESGYRDKALQYCEAIASSITSQTKRSPYHHSLLVSALDDLSKRLKQSPKDETSSWISKPSIDKVSGSVWAKFSNFVAGDENDASANGSSSGGPEIGPFARIAGGTPTISRSPSISDLHGSYGAGLAMTAVNGAIPIPQNKTASRYAPGTGYTPPAYEPQPGSSYGSQPRTSFEQRSSSDLRRSYEPSSRQPSEYRPTSQAGSQSNSYIPQTNATFATQPSFGSYGGSDSPYAPYGDNASPYAHQSPGTPVSERPPPSNVYDSPQSLANGDLHPVNSYNPQGSSFDSRTSSSSYEPPTTSGYEPPSNGGYEPPSSNGYEPPSYVPATMDDEPDSPVDTRPKKKSFMDDDDDDYKPVPKANGEKTKAEKDREADEAFRKAAEADAQRTKEAASAPKKGWGLGGWFGGGKKEAAAEISQPGKPIRAKLGEASSFVYDPDLKRWVNKKGGGESAPTPSATPPPPRASGPPRTASGPAGLVTSAPRPASAAGGPPPMRSTQSLSDMSETISQSDSGPPGPSNLAAPPIMSRTVSNGSVTGGPPSRPGTSMSNASSIDDLLGPPTGARKGAAKGKKKGRGYIDVMGDKK